MSSLKPVGKSSSRKVSDDRQSDLSDSWVTFNVNSDLEQSANLKEMERLLREAQRESGQSSKAASSKSSKAGSTPPGTPCNSLQSTPGHSGENSPTNPTLKTVPELLDTASDKQDWVWNWSSTPEARPPKKVNYKHPASPPMNFSIRKTAAMKSGYFSWDFLQVFIPSLILTNLVAFGFGVYVGKRLTANKTD